MLIPHGGAAQIWRDGVDEPHNPSKGQIRDWGGKVEESIDGLEVATTDLPEVGARLDALEAQGPVERNIKESVAFASTETDGNVVLSGVQTLDGNATGDNQRVAILHNTIAAENGLYFTNSAGLWVRTIDMDAAEKVQWAEVHVDGGTENAGITFYTPSPVATLGADDIIWKVAADSSGIAAQVAGKADTADLDGKRNVESMVSPDYHDGMFDTNGNVIVGQRKDGSVDLGPQNRGRVMAAAFHEQVEAGDVVLNAVDNEGANVTSRSFMAYEDGGNLYVRTATGSDRVQVITGGVRGVNKEGGCITIDHATEGYIDIPLNWDFDALADDVTKMFFIPSTGQSNSVGNSSGAAITTSAVSTGRALTFEGGPRVSWGDQLKTGAIKIPRDRFSKLADCYEIDYGDTGETPTSGALAHFVDEIGATECVVGACFGFGSAAYTEIEKGTVAWTNLVHAMFRLRFYAAISDLDFEVPGLMLNLGESHMFSENDLYEGYLADLQGDFATLVATLNATPPNGRTPIAYPQSSNYSSYVDSTDPDVVFDQLDAHIASPNLILCIGPTYLSGYSVDDVHLLSAGQINWGAMAARAIWEARQGTFSGPLYAISAVRSGATVTLTFNVPVTNLTADTSAVSDPGNYGIGYLDAGDGNSVAVSSVSIASATTVTVTLDGTPTGTGQKITIALNAALNDDPGPTTGARSNLRDSSAETDSNSGSMQNWACHQIINIT